MKKITWTWKKIVTLILGFLGIGTLTSCYGTVPYVAYSKSISGTVVGDIDGDGIEEPVPGIQYTLITDEIHQYYSDYYINSSNGHFDFDIPVSRHDEVSFGITFTDVDGEENGSFKTKTVKGKISSDEDFIDFGEIHLEKADKEN